MSKTEKKETQNPVSSDQNIQTEEKEVKQMFETTETLTIGESKPYDQVMEAIINDSAIPGITSTGALKELLGVIQAIPPDRVRKMIISVPQAVAAGRHYARRYAED